MAETKKTTVKKPVTKKATEVKSIEDLRKELADKQADLFGFASNSLKGCKIMLPDQQRSSAVHRRYIQRIWYMI